MANIKFSQFTEQTDTANVQFLVGYNGSTNVRIAPGNVSSLGGSGTLNTVAMFTPDGNTLGNSLITISNIGTASESINSTAKILQVGPLTGTATLAQINLRSGAGNNGIIDAGLGSLLLRINSSSTAALELATTGALQAKSYGSGTFTGTAAYGLSVDSSGNIIETTGGAAYPFLIDTNSLYSGFVPSGLSGNPQGNTTLGIDAGNAITNGAQNTVIGNDAMKFQTARSEYAVVGYQAGFNCTGNSVTALGWQAAYAGNQDGSVSIGTSAHGTGFAANDAVAVGSLAAYTGTATGSVAIGKRAGYNGNDKTNSVLIGFDAGRSASSTGHISIGYQAGYSQTSGTSNTNIGYQAGKNNTTSQGRTMVGNEAGTFQTGSQNTGIGRYALRQGTGLQNTAVGHSAMVGNMLGSNFNTVVGYNAMSKNGAKNNNVIVGKDAARLMTTGSTNTILGSQAGDNLTTGSNNILIGYDATASAVDVSNEITLGDANITALRIPGLQSGASDGDVLTYASGTGLITLQAAGGGGGIGGSISNTQVAFGNASSEITGDVDFNFDPSTNRLRVGVDQDYSGGIFAMALNADDITTLAIMLGSSNGVTPSYINQNNNPFSSLRTRFGWAGTDTFSITTNFSERFRITSSGNVGIGTTSPVYQLQLSTDSAAKPSTNTWTITSDERVKTNIRPYKTGLEKLLQIKPKLYDYNGKAGFDVKDKNNIGVIAQDIKDIMPETVKKYNVKLNEEDKEDTELYNFDSHALTFALINSVKELNAKIENLETKIQTLENN